MNPITKENYAAIAEHYGATASEVPPRRARLVWFVVDAEGAPLARFLYRDHATDWMDAMKHGEKHWRLEHRP